MKLLGGAGLNIAGHKVPWTAIGAIAAVIGIILVIRARGGSLGAAPAGAVSSGVSGSDISGSLANLQSELATLQGELDSQMHGAPPAPPAPPGSMPPSPIGERLPPAVPSSSGQKAPVPQPWPLVRPSGDALHLAGLTAGGGWGIRNDSGPPHGLSDALLAAGAR